MHERINQHFVAMYYCVTFTIDFKFSNILALGQNIDINQQGLDENHDSVHSY